MLEQLRQEPPRPFAVPEVEVSFLNEYIGRAVRQQRVVILFVVVIYVAFGCIELLVPNSSKAFLRITMIAMPLVYLGFYAFTFAKTYLRRPELIAMLFAAVTSGLTDLAIAYFVPRRIENYLIGGSTLTTLLLCTGLRLRFRYAVAAGALYAIVTASGCVWLDFLSGERLAAWLGYVGSAIVFGGLIARRLEQHERATFIARRAADSERELAERLLLNVLPSPVAERLKRSTRTIADQFDAATVIFGDLVGFTGLASRIAAPELVELLNEVFSRFDGLATRFGLEKIKTIGDAYMIAAGVPAPREDHAEIAARMALEMLAELERFNAERGTTLAMRIGVNSGPLVAGVIGKQKFIYDLWGDTVNTASRMESHGAPGRIQISAATRALLGESFCVEGRGAIEVKGRGALETFWLLGDATTTVSAAV